MIPRTDPNRRGPQRETYMCATAAAGRAPGSARSGPSNRALVDEAMLAELQRRYLDLDATRDRHAAKLAADAALAADALAQADREAQRAADRLARVQRAFQDGFLDPEDYRDQAAGLREERDAALAAVEQARTHAERVAAGGPSLDGEAAMFERLAELRAAIVDGTRDAAGLDGLRTLLRHMFEEVRYLPVIGESHAWPEALADFGGEAYLAPILSERVFEGIDDESVPPRVRRGVLDLAAETEHVGLPLKSSCRRELASRVWPCSGASTFSSARRTCRSLHW
jgi:hypothetical protein